jgi:hypothetical protein
MFYGKYLENRGGGRMNALGLRGISVVDSGDI